MRFWSDPHSSRWLQWSQAPRWCCFGVTLMAALYLNLTPSPGAGFTLIWDKALHVICWAGVTGTLGLALYPRRLKWQAATIIALIASLTETAQHWVEGRYFDWGDIIANLIGVAIAYLFWQLLDRQRRSQ